MKQIAILACLMVSACAVPPATAPFDPAEGPLAAPEQVLDPNTAAHNFGSVVARMEPVIEAECVRLLARGDCNFQIVVDTTPGEPANAFQTRDTSGRPVIAFTVALIADARNQDELAFVMGHEAAHHILEHIPRQEQTAAISGAVTGIMAAALGGDPTMISAAQDLGSEVGARGYSKKYELEADQLGTVLAYRAGFDPARGALFFTRLPDPGDQFLGSHPPNAERIAIVQETLARLR